MAFWTGRLRFREERFFREKREERYSLLKSTIFNFLVQINIEGFEGESETLRLGSLRNLDSVRNSPFFSEAEKHLIQDIPNYLEDITELENSASSFNSDLDEYRKILKNMVENFLNDQLPQLEHFVGSEVAPLNSISVERLIQHLRPFWFLDSNFDMGLLER